MAAVMPTQGACFQAIQYHRHSHNIAVILLNCRGCLEEINGLDRYLTGRAPDEIHYMWIQGQIDHIHREMDSLVTLMREVEADINGLDLVLRIPLLRDFEDARVFALQCERAYATLVTYIVEWYQVLREVNVGQDGDDFLPAIETLDEFNNRRENLEAEGQNEVPPEPPLFAMDEAPEAVNQFEILFQEYMNNHNNNRNVNEDSDDEEEEDEGGEWEDYDSDDDEAEDEDEDEGDEYGGYEEGDEDDDSGEDDDDSDSDDSEVTITNERLNRANINEAATGDRSSSDEIAVEDHGPDELTRGALVTDEPTDNEITIPEAVTNESTIEEPVNGEDSEEFTGGYVEEDYGEDLDDSEIPNEDDNGDGLLD
jgi:hypothetical protein